MLFICCLFLSLLLLLFVIFCCILNDVNVRISAVLYCYILYLKHFPFTAPHLQQNKTLKENHIPFSSFFFVVKAIYEISFYNTTFSCYVILFVVFSHFFLHIYPFIPSQFCFTLLNVLLLCIFILSSWAVHVFLPPICLSIFVVSFYLNYLF